MRLIVVDRDGVINVERRGYVTTAAQWEPIAGSLQAIAHLTNAGYRVAVASNQAGLARERLNYDDLAAIHRKMHRLAGEAGGSIDAIFFCPHTDDDACSCRKPRPGLLLDAAQRYQIPAGEMLFIGDSWRDIQAAHRAGAAPALVLTGHGSRTAHECAQALADVPVYDDLRAVSDAILAQSVYTSKLLTNKAFFSIKARRGST